MYALWSPGGIGGGGSETELMLVLMVLSREGSRRRGRVYSANGVGYSQRGVKSGDGMVLEFERCRRTSSLILGSSIVVDNNCL